MPFNWNKLLNPTIRMRYSHGYQDGIAQVNAAAANWPGAPVVNGWLIPYNARDVWDELTLRAGHGTIVSCL